MYMHSARDAAARERLPASACPRENERPARPAIGRRVPAPWRTRGRRAVRLRAVAGRECGARGPGLRAGTDGHRRVPPRRLSRPPGHRARLEGDTGAGRLGVSDQARGAPPADPSGRLHRGAALERDRDLFLRRSPRAPAGPVVHPGRNPSELGRRRHRPRGRPPARARHHRVRRADVGGPALVVERPEPRARRRAATADRGSLRPGGAREGSGRVSPSPRPPRGRGVLRHRQYLRAVESGATMQIDVHDETID